VEPIKQDTGVSRDIFQTEFESDLKKDVNQLVQEARDRAMTAPVVNTSKLFDYRLKFSSDYVVSGFNNAVLINRFQPYAGGAGPVNLSNTDLINGIIRMGISDVFEDIKFVGGFRISTNLQDNDYFASFQNYKRRFDWGLTYYRSVLNDFPIYNPNTEPVKAILSNKLFSNLYQANIAYPFDEVRSVRLMVGYRSDRVVLRTDANAPQSLNFPDSLLRYGLARFEFVHDNTINPALNIWNGLRYKVYVESFSRLVASNNEGRNTFNIGVDARHYLPIYRNFIWAVRGAFDASLGNQKLIYYVGGADGWISPKFNQQNRPANDDTYAYQSLALNLRGHNQNAANGNNAAVINSELRLPIFTTFFNRPVNNAFLRNLQLVQFLDLGTAWNGQFRAIDRPDEIYGVPPVQVRIKTGGIGPFVGGYGFGVRSTLLGYFLRLDTGWPMTGVFKGKPIWYFSMGLDF
jgi:hypothetical protein